MNTVEEFKHEGLLIKINVDEEPMNPRDWDNLGTMLCYNDRYCLGDKYVDSYLRDMTNFSSWDELESEIKRLEEAPVVLPLYLHAHSGLSMRTMSFNDPWDSSQVGFIYVSRHDLLREYKKKRISKKLIEEATQVLENEVCVYDQYLRGEIYCYSVEGFDGEILDSCCGFYGLDFCIEQAAEAAEACAQNLVKTNPVPKMEPLGSLYI